MYTTFWIFIVMFVYIFGINVLQHVTSGITPASVFYISFKVKQLHKDFILAEYNQRKKTGSLLISSWGNIRFCDLVLIHKNTPYWSLQHGAIVLRLIRIFRRELGQWLLLKWSRIFQLKSTAGAKKLPKPQLLLPENLMTWVYALPNTLYCSMVKWVWEKM